MYLFHDKMMVRRLLLFTFLVAETILLLSSPEVAAQESRYYPGKVHIMAEYSVVFFPAGVTRLFFDTLECKDCKERLPRWRFIGDLKIDSLERNGVTEPLEKESQMVGIIISPRALLDCMQRDKAYCLERVFPASIPYDTLRWSKVGQQYRRIPDLSKHFCVRFSENRTLDTIISRLKSVRELSSVSVVPKIVDD